MPSEPPTTSYALCAHLEGTVRKLSGAQKTWIRGIVTGGTATPEDVKKVKDLLGVGDWPEEVLTDYQTNEGEFDAGPKVVLYLFKNKKSVDGMSVRVSVDDWSPYIPWG